MPSVLKSTLASVGCATGVCFRVVFADGSEHRNREGKPEFVVRFKTPRAQRRAILFGHIGFLESYFDQEIEIDGSLAALFRAGLDGKFAHHPNRLVRLRNAWHELRFSNRSLPRAKANAEFHYALGTGFYRLWLDHPLMMYTCAYWKGGTRTLEEAQRNKVDHVCRKLLLEPGDTVVDIGCGWGGFLFHAWEHYGAIGTGINVTGEQVAALRGEIARRGLQDKVCAVEADLRQVPGSYDKCASIGVLEHAGRDQLAQVVRAHADCLKPGGIGVLHFIGHVGRHPTEFWIRKHIFPGGWIPSLAQTLEQMELSGLEILDVENLRRHYALTLDAWAERFEANWEKIHALDPRRFDQRFRRKWRAYLYSCAEMFRSPGGYTHLFQITYSKGNVGRSYPMSRSFLYAPAASGNSLDAEG